MIDLNKIMLVGICIVNFVGNILKIKEIVKSQTK